MSNGRRRMPPPRTAPRGGPSGGRKPKKSRKNSRAPQIVAGLAAVIVLGGLGTVGYYVADRAIPSPKPSVDANKAKAVKRPKVPATIKPPGPPGWPGLHVTPPDECFYPKASDINKQDYAQAVQGLLSRGVLTVFLDGKFRGGDPVPRAEFLGWCYNAVQAQTAEKDKDNKNADPLAGGTPRKGFKDKEPTGEEFRDVEPDHWAVQVLATLKGNGMEAISDRFMRPDEPLTRQEWSHYAMALATVPEELEKAANSDIEPTKLGVALRKMNFTDFAKVEPSYVNYLYAIANHDKRKNWIMEVFPPPLNPGPFNPGKSMTRGEAALWIGEFYEEIGKGIP